MVHLDCQHAPTATLERVTVSSSSLLATGSTPCGHSSELSALCQRRNAPAESGAATDYNGPAPATPEAAPAARGAAGAYNRY